MAAENGPHDFTHEGDFIPEDLQTEKQDDFVGADDPEFEFDDDSMELSVARDEISRGSEGGAFSADAITADGLIDEDFEKELGTSTEEDLHEFSSAEKFGVVEVAGDDLYGRKVIVISACKLPSNKSFHHQKLLQYIKHTLDKYVEQDYVLVYFHYGLNSGNKPKLSWLLQAYREFDRKYKKNLKMLYLVHPTSFIKLMWKIFRPFISAKFGKKMMYVNSLMELKQHLPFDQLAIPTPVMEFDNKNAERHKQAQSSDGSTDRKLKKTLQFGASLQDIQQNTGRIIPLPIEQSIEYLKATSGDEVEGLFRRCARVSTMKEVQEKYDNGEEVDFHLYGDPHLAAAILKKFLREIQEPVMTYNLFESITQLSFLEASSQLTEVKKLVQNELPEDNYAILKYVFQFLQQVVSKSEVNHMTAENIAVVFGPNIAWPRGQANLATVEHAVKLSLVLVQNFDAVFQR